MTQGRIALSPRPLSDAWVALLDSIEEGLGALPPVLVDTLPTDLGRVPPSLVERARRTLQRMAEVQAALEHQRTEIGEELIALSAVKASAARAAAPPVPHFLDTLA